ncbi:hypothetical protein PHYSODRAFT_490337 [Phytophthora sojae]|uniref:RxLR effector protein n=1 Tax=Phytophthora sojae (strain P6497) TaxID=1094619 RepID=G4ZB18_PHYSP|nr:hypothetical protein PHYSODRAFT_490337 [Phytophthora sojae]EGZ21237.1 hypothetical protein PHYSODRAFT_490337 [Phytophthora sojae]|eukprot:XP_009523954.1 hypothetical protein PHYSODRAFT_490337 [Phytophthora sojae]
MKFFLAQVLAAVALLTSGTVADAEPTDPNGGDGGNLQSLSLKPGEYFKCMEVHWGSHVRKTRISQYEQDARR